MVEAFKQSGISGRRQVPVAMRYRGVVVENAFKVDLLIEDRLIVELKSIDKLLPVHGKQVMTYLRLMDLPLGLLMNFGQVTLKDGLKRVANNHF